MKNVQQTSFLDNLSVASPCSVSWDEMVGSERERNCSGCNKTVYNVSDMTNEEAETFLRENTTAECFKLRRRSDGTIVTDDCPRALRMVRDRCKLAAKIAFGMFAFIISLPAALTQSIHTQQPLLMHPYYPHPAQPYYPHPPGGAWMGKRSRPIKVIDRRPIIESTSNDASGAAVTTSVEARIVTKQRTTSDGKKILLVAPDREGNVIRTSQINTVGSTANLNRFVDTRAADFTSKAREAIAEKKYKLAEFYFEKSLAVCDQQKNSDPIFRKQLETELRNLRVRYFDSTEGSNNDSHSRGTELQVDPASDSPRN